MFAIDIAPFETGAHRVVRTPSAESVGLEPVPEEIEVTQFRDLEVAADLFCERRRILVHLQARATAALTCDRTLRPFDERLEGAYSVLFAAPEAQPAEAESDDYDEVRTFSPTDPSLDLTDIVRDTLLLAVPQRKVAPGAEEEKLTTSFGAEANGSTTPVDPRWEKLRQLRDE